jgi:hypothetical protein
MGQMLKDFREKRKNIIRLKVGRKQPSTIRPSTPQSVRGENTEERNKKLTMMDYCE